MTLPIAKVNIKLVDESGNDLSSGGSSGQGEQPVVVENNFVYYNGSLVKYNGYYNLVTYTEE